MADTNNELTLIQKALDRVDIKSLLNHGAGSIVWSEGVEGVTQDDLLAYTREIALHCAVALGASQPAAALADGWISVDERLPEKNTEVLIAFSKSILPATGQYTGSARDNNGGATRARTTPMR